MYLVTIYLLIRIQRGEVAVYTAKYKNAKETLINASEFNESAWCCFNDSNIESILIGCDYCSPNSTVENIEQM